ncbi:MAG: CopD family protein [Burkholderiaceae bacterium]|nr:CopD family protein [Burkholderiaceae bacterium]
MIYPLTKLLHLSAAIVWLGGMTFMLLALRPVAGAQLQPPARAPLMAAVMGRFFPLVWLCIAVLLLTGEGMLLLVGMKAAPLGWHLMLGIGLLMFAIFGHIHFGPFRRLKLAIAASDWPEAGRRLGQIQKMVQINFALGWLAVAAVLLVR